MKKSFFLYKKINNEDTIQVDFCIRISITCTQAYPPFAGTSMQVRNSYHFTLLSLIFLLRNIQPECYPVVNVLLPTTGNPLAKYTVNSEIFARVLFSRNFAYAKFLENKILAKWRYRSAVY